MKTNRIIRAGIIGSAYWLAGMLFLLIAASEAFGWWGLIAAGAWLYTMVMCGAMWGFLDWVYDHLEG